MYVLLRTKGMQLRNHANTHMGFGRIFSRGGGSRGFSQNFFQGWAKSGEIWFSVLEIEKTTFFANHFKIQGDKPTLPPTSDAHEHTNSEAFASLKGLRHIYIYRKFRMLEVRKNEISLRKMSAQLRTLEGTLVGCVERR